MGAWFSAQQTLVTRVRVALLLLRLERLFQGMLGAFDLCAKYNSTVLHVFGVGI